MKRTVRLALSADRDVVRLARNLDERSPSSTAVLRAMLQRAFESLEFAAERGFAGPRPGYRQLFLPFGGSGYVVRYRVQETSVVVTRIFHGRERR